jgi:hypothetical protein
MIDVLAGLKVTAAADSDPQPRSRSAGLDVYVGRSGRCQRRFVRRTLQIQACSCADVASIAESGAA